MSWFYDVLKRVEQEREPASSPEVNLDASGGAEFLAALEGVSGIVNHKAKTAAARVQSAPLEDAFPQAGTRAPDHSFSALSEHVISAEASYPRLQLAVGERSRLVFQSDRHGLAAEQYRLLCRNLVQRLPKGGVVMVTSPGEGDGKTLTALNLSAGMAEAGDPTLLLELDVRRPGIRQLLGIDASPGQIDCTQVEADHPHHSICLVEELHFHVAMVAQLLPDPARLLHGDAVERLLDWAKRHFRWVIIDSAPVVPVADVSVLAPYADAVLMVIRAQSTPRDLLKRAVEMLGKRLSGVILNEATAYSNPYYRYLRRQYQMR